MIRTIALLLIIVSMILQADLSPVAAAPPEKQSEQKQSFFSRMTSKMRFKSPGFSNPFSRKPKMDESSPKKTTNNEAERMPRSEEQFDSQPENENEFASDRETPSRAKRNISERSRRQVRQSRFDDDEQENQPSIRRTGYSQRDTERSPRNSQLTRQEQIYEQLSQSEGASKLSKMSEGFEIDENELEGMPLSKIDPFTRSRETGPTRGMSPTRDVSPLREPRSAGRPSRTTNRSYANEGQDVDDVPGFHAEPQSTSRYAQQQLPRRQNDRYPTTNTNSDDLERGRERVEEYSSMPPRPRRSRTEQPPMESFARSVDDIERSLLEEEQRLGATPRHQNTQSQTSQPYGSRPSPEYPPLPTQSTSRQQASRRAADDDQYAETETGRDYGAHRPGNRQQQQQQQPEQRRFMPNDSEQRRPAAQMPLKQRLSSHADRLESTNSPFDRESRFARTSKIEMPSPTLSDSGLSDEWANEQPEQSRPGSDYQIHRQTWDDDFDSVLNEPAQRRKSTSRPSTGQRRYADEDFSPSSYETESNSGSQSKLRSGGQSSFGASRQNSTPARYR